MAVKKGIIGTASIVQDEFDPEENRKRVATHADGNSVSYEDTNFTSADSPVILNVFTDLGRNGHKGYIRNDGPGDIVTEISYDGTTYGSQTTLRGGDTFPLEDLKIRKIRLTYVDPTEYRVIVA